MGEKWRSQDGRLGYLRGHSPKLGPGGLVDARSRQPASCEPGSVANQLCGRPSYPVVLSKSPLNMVVQTMSVSTFTFLLHLQSGEGLGAGDGCPAEAEASYRPGMEPSEAWPAHPACGWHRGPSDSALSLQWALQHGGFRAAQGHWETWPSEKSEVTQAGPYSFRLSSIFFF